MATKIVCVAAMFLLARQCLEPYTMLQQKRQVTTEILSRGELRSLDNQSFWLRRRRRKKLFVANVMQIEAFVIRHYILWGFKWAWPEGDWKKNSFEECLLNLIFEMGSRLLQRFFVPSDRELAWSKGMWLNHLCKSFVVAQKLRFWIVKF